VVKVLNADGHIRLAAGVAWLLRGIVDAAFGPECDDMQIIERVPDDRPLTVPPSRRHYGRQQLAGVVMGFVVGVFALAATLALASTSAPAGWWIVLGVFTVACFAFAAAGLASWRNAVGRGPACAADRTGLWLRLDVRGLGRPRVGYLTWSEVTGIRVQQWRANPETRIPFVCVDAVPSAVSEALADPAVARATRRTIQTMGTPFVLSSQWVEADLGEVLSSMRELAGPGIVHAAEGA
jgi:hypothetical protein